MLPRLKKRDAMKFSMWARVTLLGLILGLVLSAPLQAQTVTGSLTDVYSAPCTDTSCLILPLPPNSNSILFSVGGTFNQVTQFEFSPDGGTTYRALTVTNLASLAAITSTTAAASTAGSFISANHNFTHVRVRVTTDTSGTSNWIIRASNNTSSIAVTLGGGGSTIGSVSQGAASATENWRVNCVSGCAGGTSDDDDATVAAGQTTGISIGLTHVFDGTNWKRLTIGTAGTSSTQVLSVQGIASGTALPVSVASIPSHAVTNAGTFAVQAAESGTWNITNISGTISLPTGASTSAKQPALGTAGSASTDVITIQGIASGTVVPISVASIPSHAVTNAGTFAVQCTSGCSATSSITDDDDATIAAAQTGVLLTVPLNYVFDGTNWKRETVGTAGTAAAQVHTIQGIASMTPILATLSGTNNIATVTTVTTVSAVTAITNALPSGSNVIGHIICDSGCSGSGGTSTADRATFTAGTTAGTLAQGTFETSPSSVADGKAGAIGITGTRAVRVSLESAAGVAWTPSVDYTHDTALGTITNVTGPEVMCRASAAVPSDVSADGDAVLNWCLRSGAQAFQPTYAGVLGSTGNGVAGTGTPRFTIASDNTAFTVNLGTAGSDPFGANADAASATGSISAKLRFIAGTGIPITGTVTVGSHAVTNAGTFVVQENGAALTSLQLLDDNQTGDSVFYRTSAGSTEDEHEIKATAGRLFSVLITNTNAAARYIRCYNLTAANTTPGTSTVFWGSAIPGDATGSGFTHNFGPNGLAFGTALTCSYTTGAADSDVAEVAANEIKATYTYK